MPTVATNDKQNLTIRLRRDTIRKAKMLAAEQSTSISALMEQQVEKLVGDEEAYQQAMRRSLELMNEGFHMGGVHNWDRESLHDRAALRDE